MKIPNLPKTPLDLDEQTSTFLSSLEVELNSHNQDGWIHAVRVSQATINVLASVGIKNPVLYDITKERASDTLFIDKFNDPDSESVDRAKKLTLGLYSFSPDLRARRKRKKEFKKAIRTYHAHNFREAVEKTSSIRVFQGDLAEVSAQLKREVTYLSARQAETFIHAQHLLDLRVQAYKLGADAVAHFRHHPSKNLILGTPVMYSTQN